MRLACLVMLAALGGTAAWGAQPLIIAHRGASKFAPENTVASARLAWTSRADGVEGDYYLTRDGQVVCIHDGDTKRTTGVPMDVRKASFAELRALNAGAIKGGQWTGERIPSFQEIVDTVPTGGKLFLEIKAGHDTLPGTKKPGPEFGPEVVAPMKRILAASHLTPPQIVFISFSDHCVAEAKRQMPQYKAHLLISYKKDKKSGRITPTLPQILDRLRGCHADGLDTQANLEVVTAEFVKAIHDAGFELHCWTVDDPAQARALRDRGVDSITTNDPAGVREALASDPK